MSTGSKPSLWSRAMVAVGFLAALGFAGTLLAAYRSQDISEHLLAALLSSLVAMFAHSWIVIYLSQTGRALKEVAADAGLGPELGEEGRRLARRVWPWVLAPLIVLLVTAFLGQSAYIHVIPVAVHHGASWALVAAQVAAVLVERRLLAANHGLLTDLADRLPG